MMNRIATRLAKAVWSCIRLACCAATPASALELTVEMRGAPSAQGQVSLALFGTAATWLKEGQALQVARAPASPLVRITLKELSPGRYALTAFHDENGNGKLDANFLGVLKEAYGFSRGVRHRTRSTNFDEAAVDLRADLTIAVRLE